MDGIQLFGRSLPTPGFEGSAGPGFALTLNFVKRSERMNKKRSFVKLISCLANFDLFRLHARSVLSTALVRFLQFS